jgi:two-component system, chemotaxis family, CheB/CheR fusion protein
VDSSPLRGLPVGVVIVGSRYDIRFINGAAQRMLSIYSPAVGEDLIHLLRGAAYTRLRPAIDATLTGDEPVEVEDFAFETPESGARYLRLVMHPYTFGADPGETDEGPADGADAGQARPPRSDGGVMIVVDDVTVLGRERDEFRERLERSESEMERVNSINQRLTERNGQLERGNRELTRINEELQVANEDLSISNEEAQAANEEVETLNEELQATNEELETLNEELQATIEELNTTSDDQRARSRDLQDNVREGEWRQQWLVSILEGLNHSLIVVDSQGGTRLRTAAFQRTFGEEEPEFLRGDGSPIPTEDSPGLRAARGEWFAEHYIVASGGEYRWYEVSGWPLIEDDATTGGALIVQDRGEARLGG